MILSQL